MPPTAALESRSEQDHLPRYLLGFGLAAFLLFDLPALFAWPTNPAWLAAVVLTVAIPAGIAVCRRRNNSHAGPAGAAAPYTGRRQP